MYSKVAKELLQGKKVTIEYTTINELLKPKSKNNFSDDKKLDTIIAKLENIENKLKLGRLIK